jgi:three-Cys-motif partner protein
MQEFGADYTRKKLNAVESYLKPYGQVLKRQQFEVLYIDACAGSGHSMPKSASTAEKESAQQAALDGFSAPVLEVDQILTGSAVRALQSDPPFHRYLLNDKKQANVRALSEIVAEEFPHLKNRVEITPLDANEMLRQVCSRYNWKKTRALVFLDPFGLQIEYETLKMLGATEAVDLWYLVPVFAMYRQVSGTGEINPDGGPRVDAALGTTAWRDNASVTESIGNDLFGQPQFRSQRAIDIESFEKVAKERLKLAFNDHVLDETLALGKSGIHYFSLMFACANPSQRAQEIAMRLAKAVLK